tara:strand:- start:740 stop:1108 length:369 start_codon:yes stop_codon:yes gene_type:complete
MKLIYLDTNFLLLPGKEGIDVFDEVKRIMEETYEIHILQASVDELYKIVTEQSGKDKAAATLALQMLDKVMIDEDKGFADDILVEKAEKGVIICTQDKELKKRVKEKGASIISVRQHHLFLR